MNLAFRNAENQIFTETYKKNVNKAMLKESQGTMIQT